MKTYVFCALDEEIPVGSIPFETIYTGIGMTRASIAFTTWYAKHHNEDLSDVLILNAGTAGSAKYPVGTILSPDTFYHGGNKMVRNEISFGSSNLICRTSNDFISFKEPITKEQQRMKLSYDCFDMESYALAALCKTFNIRFQSVKLISDNLDGTVKDWEEQIASLRPKLIDYLKTLSETFLK